MTRMTAAAAPTTSRRLLSLDVLRGLTVIGMILVNAAAGLHYGDGIAVYPLLLHAQWAGLTLADLVFPAFLMIVGVSIPLAMAQTAAGRASPAPFGPILWRVARLFLLGLLLSNLFWIQNPDGMSWRFWGVLQRIGLVYGACAILFHLTGPKVRLGLIVAILVLYWPLSLMPGLDGLAADIWQPGHNFGASLDRLLLGDHNYVKGPAGYDPEGLLSTLPAIAHGLIGVMIGEFLSRRQGAGAAWRLAAAGAVMLAVGIGWGLVFSIIKDIWSSSFALATCGLTTLALAGLHGLLDGKVAHGRAASFIIGIPAAFGVNAIAAYVLHALAGPMVGWRPLFAPFELARPVIGEPAAALIPITLFTAFIWLCMAYLRRRNWIIRV